MKALTSNHEREIFNIKNVIYQYENINRIIDNIGVHLDDIC